MIIGGGCWERPLSCSGRVKAEGGVLRTSLPHLTVARFDNLLLKVSLQLLLVSL